MVPAFPVHRPRPAPAFRSEIDRQALLLPVTITGRLGSARAAVFGRQLCRAPCRAALGGLQQGAARGLRQGSFRGGMGHIGVERRGGRVFGGGMIGHSGLALSLGFDPHT